MVPGFGLGQGLEQIGQGLAQIEQGLEKALEQGLRQRLGSRPKSIKPLTLDFLTLLKPQLLKRSWDKSDLLPYSLLTAMYTYVLQFYNSVG